MSQITTHILDTTIGKPAQGVIIILYQLQEYEEWVEMARGITNADGRISDLLPADRVLPSGHTYKMKFETANYFHQLGVSSFYPFIDIIFEITTKEHYHIPLLLNPYGYSTYRGS